MTHRHITLPFLRRAYAAELWQARVYRKSFPAIEFLAMRLGMESGVWAIQKIMMQG